MIPWIVAMMLLGTWEVATITAYDPSVGSITASGRPPIVGRTVACARPNPNRVVVIHGLGVRYCDDRHDGRTQYDVFMSTHAEAIRFGRQRRLVYHPNGEW